MSVYQSRVKNTIIDSAYGVTISAGSNTYIDAISGMFCLPYGYSCEKIKDSIKIALDKLPFHPKENFYVAETIKASEQLLLEVEMPGGSVLFLNSGSEAIESALAMALAYHNRMGNFSKKKFITRYHSYHGATLGAHSISGRNNFMDLRAEGFPTVKIHPPFPVLHNGVKEAACSITELEEIILEEDPATIAGIVFEPVNHLKGMHQCHGEYIRGIRDLCSKYNITMISDEIVTGICRTGSFLNTLNFEVCPDIVVLGKAISGGYTPASVMITNRKISSVFDSDGHWKHFSYSHTYAANPISIAAVNASFSYLSELKQAGTLGKLSTIVAQHALTLRQNPNIVRVDNSGLIIGATLNPMLGRNSGKVIEKLCFKRGIIVRGEEDWFCLLPSYTMSIAELSIVVEGVQDAIHTLSKTY